MMNMSKKAKKLAAAMAAVGMVAVMAGCGSGKDVSGIYIATPKDQPMTGYTQPPDELEAIVVKKVDKGYSASGHTIHWSKNKGEATLSSANREAILTEPDKDGNMIADMGMGIKKTVVVDKDGNLNDDSLVFGPQIFSDTYYIKVKDAKDYKDAKVQNMAKEQYEKAVKVGKAHGAWGY